MGSGNGWPVVQHLFFRQIHEDSSLQRRGKIVPFLKAPGFCKAQTDYSLLHKPHFNASAFTHLQLKVRSSVAYSGYKVSFAADTWNPTFSSYKASFNVTADANWHTVSIPFSDFSND